MVVVVEASAFAGAFFICLKIIEVLLYCLGILSFPNKLSIYRPFLGWFFYFFKKSLTKV